MGVHQEFARFAHYGHRYGSAFGDVARTGRPHQHDAQVHAAVQNGCAFDEFIPQGIGVCLVQGTRCPAVHGAADILGVHKVLDEVGALGQGLDPQRRQRRGTGAEGIDQPRVVLGGLEFCGELRGGLVGGFGQALDNQAKPDPCLAFAQVEVRGEVARAPAPAERGGVRTGRQQGFGQDFSGRIDEMHHL
ncbi:hypothetical protein D9M72_514420 [compost metagenome]